MTSLFIELCFELSIIKELIKLQDFTVKIHYDMLNTVALISIQIHVTHILKIFY